jgi:amino acid adenylation domain-containing protein
MSSKASRADIDAFLHAFLVRALPAAPTAADLQVPFLEMGANSLVLMEVQRAVEARYGITIAIPQFFQELTHAEALADYIERNQTGNVAAAAVAATESVAPASTFAIPAMPAGNDLEALFARQLESAAQLMQQVIAQQLAALGGAPVTPAVTGVSAVAPATEAAAPATDKPSSAVVMHKLLSPLEIRARGLTEQQSRHLEALIQRFTARTRQSKELAARYRPVLADSRAAVGFRFTTKEMLYPITGRKARGARIWDVDGNEYIDITMGQGVILFGHHPDFIDAALADPENDILLLGPRPPQVGEAAELLCEMTGMERVTFTNTGTEAVMAALRLARAATGRSKIVMFENAYHGHADNVMGRAVRQDGVLKSVPVAPGITQGSVDDLLLLDYGSDEALDYIRAHAHELAAVVVEPVQSRRPDLQPRAFLHELRRITAESGALLVFDEMITGFRIHQGGAQAWFGVRADLATYGKVLAGGMPIGVVAGAARIMDAIDGGMWQYGDDSYPKVDRTIFGGTFCQHPTAMIALLATLRHLKAAGPQLQETLNRRTDRLAAELNDYFEREEVPIKVVHFGSLFRFAFSANFELLFYHLMEQGIFIWEWRNYFLSTAHTDADVDAIVAAVKASVAVLRAGGFLPEKTLPPAVAPHSLIAAQKQLAVLAQINPQGSLAYHVSPLLKLTGELEVAALRSSVRQLMQRHEALRSVIVGEAVQVLPLASLAGAGEVSLTAVESEDALLAALVQHADRAFDLAHGPLFEAHLFRLGAQDHRLLLKAHHIVVDGLSMNRMVQELAALYSAALQGTPDGLPVPLQARDYAAWRQATRFDAQRDFWLDQLKGELPVLELPADRPAPPLKSFRGGRHRADVPTELFAQIRTLSRAQGCTHFMTLFAAYALWLHRLCQQDDLIVGMPVAGRSMNNGDNLVAYCTHLLPIRSRLADEQPFTAYLRTMRDTLLAAYQHQDYPFAELLDQPSLRGRRANLVATVFNLDRPGIAPSMAGLEVEWLSQPLRHTAFDQTLNLTELGERLVLECDYDLDRYDAASMARHVDSFLALLAGIVAAPETSVFHLPLLDTTAQREWLVDWNATAADYPQDRCAHELFAAQAARTPDAVAIVADGETLRYAELDAAANRLAHWLQAQGVGAETVVGVCAGRVPELSVALLAVWKAGGAYLPLDSSYPPQRLRFMLDDAGVKIVLTQAALVEHVAAEGVRTLAFDGERDVYAGLPTTAPASAASADSLAYLIYTSGSTGRPKGTLIPHRGLTNYLCWALRRYEIGQGAGAPLHSSISFDATITSLFCPLLAGRTLRMLPEGGAEIDHIRAALEAGRKQPWSFVKLTPAHLELLNAMLPEDELAGLTRFVVLGGEALLGRQVAPWRRGAPATRLINEYGPTETVVGCCVHEATDADAAGNAIPIGRPIANTRLYVLDRQLQPLPPGAKGELFIGGAGVARGYHQRPELTAERFIDVAQTGLAGIADIPTGRIYRTGDLVRHLADGTLVYLGRIDHQIKLRGFRIELGEIEAALSRQANVREALVILQQRSAQDQRLIAYVSPMAGATLEEGALRTALANELPLHMLPARIVVLDRLPLNSNGKLDRAALPPPAEAVDAGVDSVSPASTFTVAEQRIATVWRELLELARVGRDDNFFEIGGHSLLVLPLRERLQALFDKPLSPADIFRYPSVAAQARFLAETEAAANNGNIHLDDAKDVAQRRRDALKQMKDRKRV